MSADVSVSVAVLVSVVLFSEAARGLLSRGVARSGLSVHAAELVSTFQLCCCTHELRLLSEVGGAPPRLVLSFTYLASVVHALTFRGATGNPCGALEHAYRAQVSGACVLRKIACQFAAATVARETVRQVWRAGLSELHARYARQEFSCVSAIHAPLHEAFVVELVCAFAVQTVIARTREVEQKYRVHAVAAIITSVVYAGGPVTGAIFNPALAFSTQFLCSGTSFLEYSLVYWLGPLLGTMGSALLLDQMVPAGTTRSPSLLYPSVENKKEV